jgi:hypothetical protein
LRAVGQLSGHPVVVLAQPDQFAAAPDLDAELGGVLGQQALDCGLRDAEDVRMCGVQPVRRRLGDAGEEPPTGYCWPSARNCQQTALVHHLDAARVQAERTGMPGRLRLLLQHDHVHTVQPQFAGQHDAGRPTAGNDHADHEPPFRQRPVFAGSASRSSLAERRRPGTSNSRVGPVWTRR